MSSISSWAFAIAGTLRWDSGWDSCYIKFKEQINSFTKYNVIVQIQC